MEAEAHSQTTGPLWEVLTFPPAIAMHFLLVVGLERCTLGHQRLEVSLGD